MATRIKLTKHAVTREQVYTFAAGCVERGEPECGAAAVICFEWLQRPENVIAGHVKMVRLSRRAQTDNSD